MSYTVVSATSTKEIKSLPIRVRVFGKPLWCGDYTYRDKVFLNNNLPKRESFEDFYKRVSGKALKEAYSYVK